MGGSRAEPEFVRGRRVRAAGGVLRHHQAPRFLVSGGITFVADIGTLKLLHGVLGMELLTATTIAFAVAFVVNFTLSRQWTFSSGRHRPAHRQAVKFGALVAANLASTLLIVGGLSAVGVYYLATKVVATGVNAVANFFLYRQWVFR
jgi:putative flippase GtrA